MLKLQFLKEPGRYVKLSSFPVTLGRDESNDLVLDTPRVSDFHAEIDGCAEDLRIVDLLSGSGTFVNEQRVVDCCKLSPWDVIRLGAVELEINDPQTCRPNSWVLRTESDLLSSQFYTLQNTTIVGRDPDCDLTIESYLLSRRHAELTIEGGQLRVRDLGSRNGTFLNGDRIEEGTAVPGDELRFDEQRFIVVGPTISKAREDVDEDRTHLRVPDPELTQLAPIQDPEIVEAGKLVTDPEETRLMAIDKDQLKALDETPLMALDETRLMAPDEAPLMALDETPLKAPDEAQLKALDETPLMALDETRLKAPDEDQLMALDEAPLMALDETRLMALDEAQLMALDEAQLMALDETPLMAPDEAPLMAPEETEGKTLPLVGEGSLKSPPMQAAASLLADTAQQQGGRSKSRLRRSKPGQGAVDDDETAPYRLSASRHSKKSDSEKDYAWLPGLLVFVAAIVAALAIYLWRTG